MDYPFNPPQYTARTTDRSTWVTIVTVPLAPKQGFEVFCSVFGLRANGDMAIISAVALWARIGSAAPTYNTALAAFYSDTAAAGGNAPFVSDASLAVVSARFVASGNNVLLQVKGVDGDVSWTLESPTFITFFTLP